MTPERAPRIVILHGWENRRPPEHWEHHLANDLRAHGLEVDYPQLPDPDTPDIEVWLERLSALIDEPGDEPITLVAHSLAASLWLTRLARGVGPGRVTRLALVAIPSPVVLAPTVVARFIEHPAVIDPLPGVEQRVFEGENDLYSPGGVRAAYEISHEIPVEFVAGGGHLIPDTGFGEWPRMMMWALDPYGEEATGAKLKP